MPSLDIPTNRGIVITVTTRSDVIDGDVTTVQRLIDNPGPDGISFREVLEAANKSPGVYSIRFAPHLKAATINVGSWNGRELPWLLGGSVTITVDSEPDITITNEA